MKLKHLFLMLPLLLLCSCNGDKTEKKGGSKVRGASTSAPYELLVVCNKDWLGTTNGEAFRQIVNATIPCLPQEEQYFRTTTIDPSNFTKSFMFYANIISAEISRKYKKPECRIARDVYARPQIIVSLTAPDNASFNELCEQNREQILTVFTDAELLREQAKLKKKSSLTVMNQAKKQFGCEIRTPDDINFIKKKADNFFWASTEIDGEYNNLLNFCMYAYPYTSTDAFQIDNFLQKREEFMKNNVQGLEEGQYMTYNPQSIEAKNLEIDGHFVLEVRGLWEMEKVALGGPFISYAQVDTTNNRVIVTEGFVMAPGKSKREYIRQLEASLRTLKMP
jgi:hypothetical protein